jgi:hypothetical protein
MNENKTGPDGTPRSGLDTGRKALESWSNQDQESHKAEDDLVDAGSEYSFPASDPPSYMGGTAVTGAPPRDKPPREPVSQELTNPDEAKPAGDSPQGTDPARLGNTPLGPGYGGNQ